MTGPREGGEISWVDHGNLVSVTPSGGETNCLVRSVGEGGAVQWSGDAGKVLIGNVLHTGNSAAQEFDRPAGLRLSRPTGRSVVQVGGGRILKYEDGAQEPKDITFVDQPGEVLYHPAGRNIVATGVDGGVPVLKIADNLGRDARTLAEGETARGFSSLAFTAKNALLFVADHGAQVHLHRLELETGKLTTVATAVGSGRAIANVTTSPFPGGGVAWTEGGPCDLVVSRDAQLVDVRGVAAAGAVPVGWLPDRTLVVTTAGCAASSSPSSGDVYVVGEDGESRLFVRDVIAPAVRAVLPTPEPPPAAVPSEAPA